MIFDWLHCGHSTVLITNTYEHSTKPRKRETNKCCERTLTGCSGEDIEQGKV